MREALHFVLGIVTEPAMHALVHFVWQGALIALLLLTFLAVVRPRKASTRYVAACWALTAMVALPAITATRYALQESGPTLSAVADESESGREKAAPPTAEQIKSLARSVPVADTTGGIAGALLREARSHVEVSTASRWVVSTWLLGVFLLSLSHFAGWLGVQRLRRHAVEPAPTEWQELANEIAQTLGIRRAVRVVRSHALDVPATIGWLEPIVFLPVSALTNLPPRELRCLLTHELAHVWRRDYLVNLLQTSAETLLFFHPAVWWVSRLIRRERENCCDDIAASLAGDRLSYARALVSLEELRNSSPRLALGADSGSLVSRVQRLIGGSDMAHPFQRSFLAGTACAFLSLFAGSVLVLAASSELDETVAVVASAAGASEDDRITARGRWFAEHEGDFLDLEVSQRGRYRNGWQSRHPVPLDEFKNLRFEDEVEFTLERDAGTLTFSGIFAGPDGREKGSGDFTFVANERYVKDLEEFGARFLDDDELMTLAVTDLKLQDIQDLVDLDLGPFNTDELMSIAIFNVSKEFVREMSQLGFRRLRLDDLVAMRVHDVDAAYVREMQGVGLDTFSADELVGWKIHDLDADEIRAMRDTFGELSNDDALAMKIHNVSPEYAESLREAGLRFRDGDELLSLKIHGVTPRYVRSIQELGFDLNSEELLSWKIHGVDGPYLEAIAELGYPNLSPDDLLSWKIHGVDGRFLADLEKVGYGNLPSNELLSWKIHGVDADFVEGLRELGYDRVHPEDVISLKIHGATPSWIRRVHARGLEHLEVDELISLRISGVRF